MATAKNKQSTNILIGAAILAAVIAGYFMITSKKTTTTTPAIPGASGGGATTGGGGNTTTTGTTPLPAHSCATNESEFPLKMGSGRSSNYNGYCENIYMHVVQGVLNQYLRQDGFSTLTEDGVWGAKTEAAFKQYYGGINYCSYAQYNSMLSEL